jgi:uncharacterized membrane protein YjdF
MFTRDHIYSVHENDTVKEPEERVVLVREGFNLWAFVLTLLWTLSQRLWLLSTLYLILVVLVVKGGAMLELNEATQGILQFGLQLWLGLTANDAKRSALAARGFEEVAVVCAESELMGERRYYDSQAV